MKSLSFIISLMFAGLSILIGGALVASFGFDPFLSIGCVSFVAGSFAILEKYSETFRSFNLGLSLVTVCGKISNNISKNCLSPLQAGVRDRAIVINFDDISSVVYATDGETVEDIILVSGAVAHVVDGKNNSIKPTTTLLQQTYDNMFDHMVEMIGFDISPATRTEFNSIKNGRFVVITENYYKGTNGESAFEVYGLTTGLELTALSRDPNNQETQGAFQFTFMTKVNKEPKLPNALFITDYSTSKAVVDGLL